MRAQGLDSMEAIVSHGPPGEFGNADPGHDRGEWSLSAPVRFALV